VSWSESDERAAREAATSLASSVNFHALDLPDGSALVVFRQRRLLEESAYTALRTAIEAERARGEGEVAAARAGGWAEGFDEGQRNFARRAWRRMRNDFGETEADAIDNTPILPAPGDKP
jgi:hypothetical protein